MREFIVQTDMDLNGVVEFTGAGGISFKPKGEIIRCADCKRRGSDGCSMRFELGTEQWAWNSERDFCSWAKRREE